MAYILRHWNGELSLSKSYWVNFLLISNGFFFIFPLLINIFFTISFKLASILMIFFWISSVLLFMWSTIGLWKSSNHHIKKYKKYFWSILVQVIVVLNLMQLMITSYRTIFPQISYYANILFDRALPRYKIDIFENGRKLVLTGGIKSGVTKEIKKYFTRYPNIEILYLNSNGGLILEANKLSKFIKSKNILTYVETVCNSACVDIFIAGKKRILHQNASLGFHAPGIPGYNNNDLIFMAKNQINFYINNSISREFSIKAFSIPHETIWEPSHEELLKANIVTHILNIDKEM